LRYTTDQRRIAPAYMHLNANKPAPLEAASICRVRLSLVFGIGVSRPPSFPGNLSGRTAYDSSGADGAARARPVFDDDRLAESC
jgi:hypothetical protein